MFPSLKVPLIVLDKFAPDRIIIEPSGVGKLSDVIKAVKNVAEGKEIILFLRKTNDSKTPFYTIDLDTDGYIRQIHTRYNGDIEEDPEKEDIKAFLINWANAKSNLVNKKSIKLNYGALCAKE